MTAVKSGGPTGSPLTPTAKITPAELIERYTPLLAADVWSAIGDFVRSAVTDCVGQGPYTTKQMLHAAAKLTAWAHLSGCPLERETVFSRYSVALFVQNECGHMARKSRGTYRAALLRMGEALSPANNAERLPRLAPGHVPAPYTRAEQAALRSWARGGITKYRRDNSAILLALGLGAGLTAGEMTRLRVRNVIADSSGVLLKVVGANPRAVPVLKEWEEPIADSVLSGREEDEYLLAPRAKTTRAHVVADNNKTYNEGSPNSGRMRSTWIVTHLAAGAPALALRAAAGVKNLEALDRYLPFVPEPHPVAARHILRGESPLG